MKNINQIVSERLDSMRLSEGAMEVINDTEISLIAELFGDFETAEEVEEYIEREYGTYEARQLAKKISSSDEWILEDCRELCEMAGLEDEWEAADGDTFESVVYKAADKLNVVI